MTAENWGMLFGLIAGAETLWALAHWRGTRAHRLSLVLLRMTFIGMPLAFGAATALFVHGGGGLGGFLLGVGATCGAAWSILDVGGVNRAHFQPGEDL